MYPETFEKLIEKLEKLPGVGNKTALRYAFKMLEFSKEELEETGKIIQDLTRVKKCENCGFLTEDDLCQFCKDESRDKHTLMIVENSQDVVAIEKTNSYHGQYNVLGTLISSTKGIFPDDINFYKLLNRINGIEEVIIALTSSMDGEMTALYISKLLEEKGVKVTRIASGLPMGGSIDYADELTIISALNNRKEIK